MSRMYVVNEWTNAAAYSGEMIGDRLKKSEGLHFNRDGSANTDLYADEPKQKKPSIHIRDRILPQQKRVTTLTNQMRDLVSEYKAGNIDIDEYSMLLSVLAAKRSRAEILLAKAKSVRAPFEIEEEEAISLGKTQVKSEKSFKTSKRIATEGNRFKGNKKPMKYNSNFLSKALTFLAKNDWAVFVGSSTILAIAAKIIF